MADKWGAGVVLLAAKAAAGALAAVSVAAQEKMPKEDVKFQKNVKPSVLRCVSRNKKLPKTQTLTKNDRITA